MCQCFVNLFYIRQELSEDNEDGRQQPNLSSNNQLDEVCVKS